MEEERVKVVFEFDRKDYENVLFLLDQEQDKETEKVWEVIKSEDVVISKEMLAKKFGISQKEVLAMFASFAIMWAQKKRFIVQNKQSKNCLFLHPPITS